jgi:outer membrane protein
LLAEVEKKIEEFMRRFAPVIKISICAFGAAMLLSLTGFFSSTARANDARPGIAYPEPHWGIGIGLRYAESPFVNGDQRLTDIVPLLFYGGERFFLHGLEGGVRLLRGDRVQLNGLLRCRFFDFPRHPIPNNSIDGGLQLRHELFRDWTMRWELLSDSASRAYLEAGPERTVGDDDAALTTYAGVRVKSARFNNHFYGLDAADLGAGIDWRVRIEGRARIAGDWHLLTRLGGTYFDRETFASPFLKDRMAWDVFVGVAFLRFGPEQPPSRPEDGSYWRIAYGRSTRARLATIAHGGNTQIQSMSSLFYGHPLSRQFLGGPIDIYLTPGLVLHPSSDLQDASPEVVIAIKAYYTIPWPVRVRLGAGEGISYVRKIPYVERTDVEARGYEPSKLLNFLDFSVDLSAGDLFSTPSAGKLWFGYSIHHRSGIFADASQFGRVNGGSNYQTLYLQYHF